MTSHSGDLLARVPIGDVRRLYRRAGAVHVGAVREGTLTAAQQSKIDFHVRNSRGELLFASTWLLGEGETEYWIYEEAAALLGLNLDEIGIRFVNFKWSGAEPLLKVANALGISWFLTADGDGEGNNLVKTATAHLEGRTASEHIHQLPFRTIENCLAENGYGPIFESHISPQKQSSITSKPGDLAYWDQVLRAGDDKSKPLVAQEVVEEMRKRGVAGVPPDVQIVIERVKALAIS